MSPIYDEVVPEISPEIKQEIDALVEQALTAAEIFLTFDQEKIDHIVHRMALAGLDHHLELARLAVEETGRGVLEDKVTKNIFAAEEVYHSIKYKKTVGIIRVNEEEDYYEVAEPAGVIAAVVPVTNPTSTVIFKALICLKTRNPVIFSFHPGAQRCSAAAAEIMRRAAIEAGAPPGCISWLSQPGHASTGYLMRHPGVALILATGGAGLVRAAYSCGKPALGVGPGNVPCLIEKTANLKRAVNDLILSKTFDNGMICASEQAVVVEKAVAGEVRRLLVASGCYFLSPEEKRMLEAIAVRTDSCSINPQIVGQPAAKIASTAGFEVPPTTKILIAELKEVGPTEPLSLEKLCPILAYYEEEDFNAALKRCSEVVAFGGLGHTAVIHSADEEKVRHFAERIRTGRIIVNAPATHGAIGDIYNVNVPSFTLGCGSIGSNATTANVSVDNLINIKKVAKRRPKLQWFRVPERIYFQEGALQYLTKLPGVERALIVTDQDVLRLGLVDKVLYHLRRRLNTVAIEIFPEVEPDPSLDTVRHGVEIMKSFKPDTLIAVGGGSPIDAAKAMWLFYEHPEVEFEFLRLKFLDIRKRTYKYPKLGRKVKMIAIPTTSGTGSEVTAFAVISDRGRQIKYPLADYELTPDVAIIDPELVMTLPPRVTADSGLDVLTHALEAYVSVMASDYTDALALKAIELVFRYLPRAYHRPDDREARAKMHNAATIAGMAFTNAFLGINHSLAHKIGAAFNIPHGRANAILLPYVIAYNASLPQKFVSFPQYEYFIAPEKYCRIARYLELPSATVEEGVRSLIHAVRRLLAELEVPPTIAAAGVEATAFAAALPQLAEEAFNDQCTISNPRQPLINELADLLRLTYGPPLSAEVSPHLLHYGYLD